MQPDHLSSIRFEDLPLHPTLHSGVRKLGFTYCTPIQAQTLPRALAGEDLAGQAQTGTGKSAAFLLAAMNHLLQNPRKPGTDDKQPRAFMLAPTRELAIQILKDAESIGSETGLRMTVCYGGAGYETQRAAIEAGLDIIIGTPGRLIDFYKQNAYNLKHIDVLVLDEADRMFDLGFIDDIRYLIRKMPAPAQRKNYMFSATLSQRVLELAYEHMNSPTKIEVEPERITAERVRQAMLHVSNDEKVPLLVGLLRHHDPKRTLVFVNTKMAAEQVERALIANGFLAATLSGDVAQTRRISLLEDFKVGKLPILVATDVGRAVCTSPRFRTSSTTICRRTARITCTASAAPRAPARAVTRSAFAARPMFTGCRISRNTSATRSRCLKVATISSPPTTSRWRCASRASAARARAGLAAAASRAADVQAVAGPAERVAADQNPHPAIAPRWPSPLPQGGEGRRCRYAAFSLWAASRPGGRQPPARGCHAAAARYPDSGSLPPDRCRNAVPTAAQAGCRRRIAHVSS